MATIDRYQVIVDTQDARRSLDGLRGAVAGLIAAFSVRELAQFADSITNVRNRLNQLTPGINDTTQQFKALAGIAISARAPLAETADLYFRISRAAGSLGISQREAAEVTELVAKAITASGISAQEASGPLLQLGQALQSGRLQGDELRSILEGLPPVARALADSLGVPIGALKELGAQGKISAQDVIQAIQGARDSIERDFAATTSTIGQAAQTLKTTLGIAFDEFEQNTQVGRTVALAIEYIAFQIYQLSKNIDDIIGPLRTFAQAVGALIVFATTNKLISMFVGALGLIGGAVSGVVTSIGALRVAFAGLGSAGAVAGGGIAAFAANVITSLTPLGRLAKLAIAAASAFAAWSGIGEVIDDVSEMGDETSETARAIAEWKAEMAALTQQLDDTVDTTGQVNQALTELQTKTREGLGSYQDANEQFLENLRITRENLDLTREQIQYNDTIRRFADDYNTRIKALRDRLEELNRQPERNAELIEEINAAIARTTAEYQAQLPTVTQIAAEIQRVQEEQNRAAEAARVHEEAMRKVADAARSAQDFVRSLERSTEDVGKELRQLNMSDLEKQIDNISIRIRRDLADRIRELENVKLSLTDPAQIREIDAEIARISNAANNAIREQARLVTESQRQQRTFAYGWRKAFEEYADNATNAAKRAEEIFAKTTRGLEDLLVDFVKTGKFEWKTFVADITETLLRSQIQQLIAKTFSPDGILGGIGSALGLDGLFGGGGGANKGETASNPLYVMDVSGGMGGGRMPSVAAPTGGSLGGIFDSIKNIGSSISNGIGSIFGGGSSGGSGGGLLSSIGKGIKSIFGGFFANGGFLPAGQVGIVGERGPEMIGGPANITPMGGNVTYNIQAVDAASFKQLVARDPGFIHAVAMQGGSAIPSRR